MPRPSPEFDDRVAALMEVMRARIPESDLSFTYTRSSGPGGQNVNKLTTRATLWFQVSDSPCLSDVEKEKLAEVLSSRIGADGRMRVTSMRHRTQAANRRACIERFYELVARSLVPVKHRRKTRIPRSVSRRRLEGKQRTGTTKRLRRPPPRFED